MMQIDKEKQRLQGLVIIGVALVIMVTIAVIAFVIDVTNQPKFHDIVAPVAAPPPKLPTGWDTYVSKAQGFSIGHLSEFSPQESNISVNIVEKAAVREGFGVSFEQLGPDGLTTLYAPLMVRVTQQTLDQAVKGREAVAAEDDPRVAIVSLITSQKALTIAGHAAVRIDEKDVDRTGDQDKLPVSYTTYIFVEANGQVYTLQTTSGKSDGLNDPIAQTMLQSFTITKKSS